MPQVAIGSRNGDGDYVTFLLMSEEIAFYIFLVGLLWVVFISIRGRKEILSSRSGRLFAGGVLRDSID
jgi:hypothetical protein